MWDVHKMIHDEDDDGGDMFMTCLNDLTACKNWWEMTQDRLWSDARDERPDDHRALRRLHKRTHREKKNEWAKSMWQDMLRDDERHMRQSQVYAQDRKTHRHT